VSAQPTRRCSRAQRRVPEANVDWEVRASGIGRGGMFRRLANERGSVLSTTAEVIGVITGLLAMWQFAASHDIVPGRSPVQIVRDVVDGTSSPQPHPTFTGTDGIDGQPLDAPGGLELSACSLSWDPVDGAERYFIVRDGFRVAQTESRSLDLGFWADDGTHEFRVIAHAFGKDDSQPSDSVTVDPC
jgi:hypothetical protein